MSAGEMAEPGVRIAEALERIADVMEATAADNPIAALRDMMGFDSDPDDAPLPPRSPDPDIPLAEWETTLTLDLPAPGFRIVYEDVADVPNGFRLWLAGPGGSAQPLETPSHG